MRLWRAPDHTRLVLDMSAPVSHRLLELKNPSRIVLDIPDSRLTAEYDDLALADTPIQKIRSGIRDGRPIRIDKRCGVAHVPAHHHGHALSGTHGIGEPRLQMDRLRRYLYAFSEAVGVTPIREKKWCVQLDD